MPNNVKNIIKLKDPCDRVESISDDRYNFLIKAFDYSLDDINKYMKRLFKKIFL